MKEKFRDLLVKSGFPNEVLIDMVENTDIDFHLEQFAKLIVEECIQQNIKTANTMTVNDLSTNCGAHQFNFEIRELFDMNIVKTSSDT